MKPYQVANSNIISLTATLIVRLIAGPCCDHFGPRYTFAGCLLAGAIPTFLAGAVTNASGLYALRFFIGILGGSFVPCQVWTTGFFDKNVVGTANALAGGLGNLGGGITYFVMPAVYRGLVKDGLSSHRAWRVSFVVPGILIVFVAACLVLLCDDTPTGKWNERMAAVEESLRRHDVKMPAQEGQVVNINGGLDDVPRPSPNSSRLGSTAEIEKGHAPSQSGDEEKKRGWMDSEAQQTDAQMCMSSPHLTPSAPSINFFRLHCHHRNHPKAFPPFHPRHNLHSANPRPRRLLLLHLRRRAQHKQHPRNLLHAQLPLPHTPRLRELGRHVRPLKRRLPTPRRLPI
jgi:NNP family nitrate/nitrite transporter-like MFS transporter